VTRKSVFKTWSLTQYLNYHIDKYDRGIKDIAMYREIIIQRDRARANTNQPSSSYSRFSLFGECEEDCLHRIEKDLPNIDALREIVRLLEALKRKTLLQVEQSSDQAPGPQGSPMP
jgi:hypothetical protein